MSIQKEQRIESEIKACTNNNLDDKVRLDYHNGRDSGERLAYCGIIVRRNTDLVAQYNENGGEKYQEDRAETN